MGEDWMSRGTPVIVMLVTVTPGIQWVGPGRLPWSRKGRLTELGGRAGGAMERTRKFSGSGLALGLGSASASAWRRASQRWAWPLRSLRPGGDTR